MLCRDKSPNEKKEKINRLKTEFKIKNNFRVNKKKREAEKKEAKIG